MNRISWVVYIVFWITPAMGGVSEINCPLPVAPLVTHHPSTGAKPHKHRNHVARLPCRCEDGGGGGGYDSSETYYGDDQGGPILGASGQPGIGGLWGDHGGWDRVGKTINGVPEIPTWMMTGLGIAGMLLLL